MLPSLTTQGLLVPKTYILQKELENDQVFPAQRVPFMDTERGPGGNNLLREAQLWPQSQAHSPPSLAVSQAQTRGLHLSLQGDRQEENCAKPTLGIPGGTRHPHHGRV